MRRLVELLTNDLRSDALKPHELKRTIHVRACDLLLRIQHAPPLPAVCGAVLQYLVELRSGAKALDIFLGNKRRAAGRSTSDGTADRRL